MNKTLLVTIAFFTTSSLLKSQNVGINQTGLDPDNSAMLDVSATNKGILVPRMTKTQKFLIPSPSNGLLVYQTDDTAGFWYYEQKQWVPLMRSITFGQALTGGMVQGKGSVDLKKTGVAAAQYGDPNGYPIITLNEYGQIVLAGTQKLVDNDTLNEIQKISLTTDTLRLNKNGGFVHLKGFWSTLGNSGLSAANNFLGTTSNIPLRFRVNNTWFGELNASNNNISFGENANRNSTGNSNIAIGREALRANFTIPRWGGSPYTITIPEAITQLMELEPCIITPRVIIILELVTNHLPLILQEALILVSVLEVYKITHQVPTMWEWVCIPCCIIFPVS